MSAAPATGPRIGLLGGAFDPPHMAHRTLALAALEQLQLDSLRILPTGDAWHKARTLSPAPHRLAMARLAFADLDRVVVDDRETRRSGPTYTIDTLDALASEQGPAQWFLLIGADQAERFTTWHRWAEVLQRCTLCVVPRPGYPALAQALAALPPGRCRILDFPALDLSATALREQLAQGECPANALQPAVARYIEQHHLYQTAR